MDQEEKQNSHIYSGAALRGPGGARTVLPSVSVCKPLILNPTPL